MPAQRRKRNRDTSRKYKRKWKTGEAKRKDTSGLTPQVERKRRGEKESE